MAETARPRRARALSGLAASVGVVVVALGSFMVWDGATAPQEAIAPPLASQAAVVIAPEASPSATASPASAPRLGVRPEVVVVPALGVRAAALPIATVDGALTPPADPQQLGWWSGGSRAGADSGATVLTGHTVNAGGGALDDLESLTGGDRVVVESARAQVAYEVDSVSVLSRAELARRSADLFSRSGPGRLVLITCEDWDGTSYLSNVVVIARPMR